MQERRVLLSKQIAISEFKDKIEGIKLPKQLQKEFFSRYDIFEKKAYRSVHGFYKTKKFRSTGDFASKYSTSNSVQIPTKEDFNHHDELKGKPFERNVHNFKIRKNPAIYRSFSALATIDTISVHGSY